MCPFALLDLHMLESMLREEKEEDYLLESRLREDDYVSIKAKCG